ncbi:MAG: hypothetical protein ACYSRQ_05670, partial [Planctomycetota bacterium]
MNMKYGENELKTGVMNKNVRRSMKRVLLTAATCLMLFNNCLYAGVSWITNRSFEYDGGIPNILIQLPTGWDDASLNVSKFRAGVFSDWSSDGIYGLDIISNSFISLNNGDSAIVSQDLYLDDVNDIFFDMKLETDLIGTDWLNTKRLAVVKIDDDVVWDSTILGSGDLRGEY